MLHEDVKYIKKNKCNFLKVQKGKAIPKKWRNIFKQTKWSTNGMHGRIMVWAVNHIDV